MSDELLLLLFTFDKRKLTINKFFETYYYHWSFQCESSSELKTNTTNYYHQNIICTYQKPAIRKDDVKGSQSHVHKC